ncbi:MAG TPA: TetR/AcrR family transcriptional regulator, partial [Aliidongia sp.]|nr:TetR/AcrR family transcriptional regulator [Aliidongia sp.]
MDLPTSPPRQTRRFEQKREAILDAAAALFNEKGVRGATLQDVAQRVGLMTNSITYYYRKKEELATACLLRTIEALDSLIAAVDLAAPPEARIRQFLRLYARLLADIATGAQPQLIMFHDIRALASPHDAEVFASYTAMFRRMRALLDRPGEPPPERMKRNGRAHLLISVVHGIRNWIDRYEPDGYARAAERTADILLGGLAGTGSAWSLRPPEIAWPAIDEVSPEAFLRSATYLINEQGYRGASVEKISARLNVTKGSFYHHIDNKDDLVAACFRRSFAAVRRVQHAAEARHATGWDRLSAAATEIIRYQLSDQGPALRASAFSAL